jgi:AcrR family transcriptional regulator
MAKQIKNTDEDRKKEILEAALHCFLHFGYAKTSMDDVAKKAMLSRPLIYLKFKNKEDLLLGLYDDILGSTTSESESILGLKISNKEKLMKLFQIMIIGPWDKISGYPMSQEFYNTCDLMDPKTFQKYEKQKLKIATGILGDKASAEVLVLAIEGLMMDLPTTTTLKKRIEILVEKFTS